MKLRTAIIGMGKMGHIRKRELDAHPGFEVVAQCDINKDIAADFPDLFFSCQWKDIVSLDIDVVFVCAYNYVTADIVCAALNNGCHVFCEKPPGCSVEDVQRIIAAEKAAGKKVLKFGFNHRFHYAIMEAKAIVESGRYGRILWARGIYGKAGGHFFEKDWRAYPEKSGGGILLDQGIHMADLLIYYLGDFVEVKSFVENMYWKNMPMEDNVFAILKTADSKVAMLHSSATHWRHRFSLYLSLEDGYVSVNGILSSTRSYGEESINFGKRQFEGETLAFGKPKEEIIYFDTDDSWKLEIEEFYDCITGKKENVTGCSDDALRVMELVEKIYRCGK